jgi:hypothetical protein
MTIPVLILKCNNSFLLRSGDFEIVQVAGYGEWIVGKRPIVEPALLIGVDAVLSFQFCSGNMNRG